MSVIPNFKQKLHYSKLPGYAMVPRTELRFWRIL